MEQAQASGRQGEEQEGKGRGKDPREEEPVQARPWCSVPGGQLGPSLIANTACVEENCSVFIVNTFLCSVWYCLLFFYSSNPGSQTQE